MKILRFSCYIFGALWAIVGVLAVLVFILVLSSEISQHQYLVFVPPSSVLSLFLGLIFGTFCIYIGQGLVRLQNWARTIGAAFNLAMGATLLVLSLVGLSGSLGHSLGESLLLSPAMGATVAILMVVFGYQLTTRCAMTVFFGLFATPPSPEPVPCPTCRTTYLDLDRLRCPQCDAESQFGKPPRMAKLVHMETGDSYRVHLNKLTHIGRDNPAAEIQLEDPLVSREHALIEYAEGHFILHAEKDLNGTFVNDMERRVSESEIRNSDELKFGGSRLRFVVEY